MSLYADYLRERTQDMILEIDTGFATYRYLHEHKAVYIIDIFTVHDARKKGHGRQLADAIVDIAKQAGCVELIGTVSLAAFGSTESLKALLAYGMTLKSAGQDFIVLRKDI